MIHNDFEDVLDILSFGTCLDQCEQNENCKYFVHLNRTVEYGSTQYQCLTYKECNSIIYFEENAIIHEKTPCCNTLILKRIFEEEM